MCSQYYKTNGVVVGHGTKNVALGKRFFGTLDKPGFPAGMEWFNAASTQPETNFRQFGTEDGNQLAEYSVLNLVTISDVFP